MMTIFENGESSRKRRSFVRAWGGIALAILISCSLTGCSSLALHKKPPQENLPRNPWIKKARPEKEPNWFTSLFLRERKQPDSPSAWLAQERPE
jgi:hypothetical protein